MRDPSTGRTGVALTQEDLAVATKTLTDKIEALPPEKRAEVEDFVEFLAQRGTPGAQEDARHPSVPAELLKQIGAERDALLKEHGLIETDEILQDLREDGGR
jgi:hypothetical protein